MDKREKKQKIIVSIRGRHAPFINDVYTMTENAPRLIALIAISSQVRDVTDVVVLSLLRESILRIGL